MTEPIVFISRNKIRHGRIKEFRKYYQDNIQSIFDGKSATLAQLSYENEEATEFMVIRLFPNAEALEFQIQGAEIRSRQTYKFIEPISIEIFGTPKPATLERMREIAGSGVAVIINPNFVGGFIR